MTDFDSFSGWLGLFLCAAVVCVVVIWYTFRTQVAPPLGWGRAAAHGYVHEPDPDAA